MEERARCRAARGAPRAKTHPTPQLPGLMAEETRPVELERIPSAYVNRDDRIMNSVLRISAKIVGAFLFVAGWISTAKLPGSFTDLPEASAALTATLGLLVSGWWLWRIGSEKPRL